MAKGASYRYYYDLAGNITKRETYDFSITGLGDVKKTETLGYNDSSWGDRLTSWQGTTITYDEIGNPTWYSIDYLTCLLTWNGRQLTSFENMDGLRTYTYNEEGIRIAKNDRGTLHTYQLNGTQIISETWGNHTIFYIYDENGMIAGMRYRTSSYAEGVFDEYLFEKNLQGDVVAIYNASGIKLVSYTYDAWGKVTTTYSNNGASTPARFNPFKYRGYYHDSDTNLYYLNSRYYDPATGRFINADTTDILTATPDALTDKNLYAYCDNNPIMRRDDGGEFWNILIGAGVGALVSAALTFGFQLLDEEGPSIKSKEFWAHVGISAAIGAVSGGLAASGVLIGGQIACNSILGAVGGLADTAIDDDGTKSVGEYLLRTLEGATIGAVAGFLGGKGSATKHVTNSFKRVLKTGNWSYYFTQINRQAARDGLKAIPGIIKAIIPSVTKSMLRIAWQRS